MITSTLIAACGMNCGICSGHMREKNTCVGCRGADLGKPGYCRSCKMVSCTKEKGIKYCFDCEKYPCTRLKQLDKRYRTKYGMSMLENLEYIKKHGIRAFVKSEKARWKCPSCGKLICVHRPNCLNCGYERNLNLPK